MTTTLTRIPGTAPIKAEFLIGTPALASSTSSRPEEVTTHESANVAEITHTRTVRRREEDADAPQEGEPPAKKPKLSRAQHKKLAKEAKQKQRGQNKARRFLRVSDEVDVCWKVACSLPCDASCRGSHDLPAYIASKPPDLYWTPSPVLLNTAPFVFPRSSPPQNPYEEFPSLDVLTICPYYREYGQCKYGFKCRFLGGHSKEEEDGTLLLLTDPEREAVAASGSVEKNRIEMSVLKSLRKKEYPLSRAKEYEAKVLSKPEVPEKQGAEERTVDDDPEPIIVMPEKKRLHWEGLTYLAPLTTVGNLPFRRLCSSLGCDITCGEMGLALSFLQGSKEEWSLVRRHPSERIFGVQIAGNTAATLANTAEVIGRQCDGNIDFVDLNCGCPIDLVYQQGAGSALLSMGTRLGKMVKGMAYALGDIPVTIKMRTGVKDNSPTAHKLFPKTHAWGAGAVAIHGRSRQQRYSREADWSYIKRCVDELREFEEENELPKMLFWGNGDCYSWQQYDECMRASGVDGILIGRGGLIKPWIFTEIKEQRVWDISSRERLEFIRRYAEFGLSHWGTDTAGVNATRRYLCEALSFWYRYIPVGLLEYLPPKLNDRPPAYQGRDELETLLASGDSRVWVQISEMFLGPAPTGWTFTPKHKSNTYSTADVDDQAEAQG